MHFTHRSPILHTKTSLVIFKGTKSSTHQNFNSRTKGPTWKKSMLLLSVSEGFFFTFLVFPLGPYFHSCLYVIHDIPIMKGITLSKNPKISSKTSSFMQKHRNEKLKIIIIKIKRLKESIKPSHNEGFGKKKQQKSKNSQFLKNLNSTEQYNHIPNNTPPAT